MFSVWLLPADSLPQFKMSIWAAAWQNQQKWPVHPAKTQISLGICPVWSVFTVRFMVAKDPVLLHATENSDQTGRMPRLIWDLPGACHFVGFVMHRLILYTLNILLSIYVTHTVFNSITRTKPSGYISSLFNRSVLVVNCWVIIHCLEVQVIYLLTTDRQTVNYYSTIHALELTYYDSNTQDRLKKQLYRSDSSNIPPLNWRNPVKDLTVTQAFTRL